MVEYGRIHTDGSRSGGQPAQGYGVVTAANYTSPIGGAGVVTHGVVGVATQSDADLLEEMRFTYETFCSEGYNDPDYTEALDYEIEARGWEAAFAVAVAKLRQPTQSDALREENERLREHLISALDTLRDAEVCDDNCGPCNEARATLEQSK